MLINDLLSLPIRGLMGIYRLQHTPPTDNVSDMDYLTGQLMELEVLRQMGEVSGESFEKRSAELRGRLDKARGLAVK
jgi:hypothetical protein